MLTLAHLFVHGFGSAIAVRAASGMAGAAVSTMALYSQGALAQQQIEQGAIVQRGWLNRRVAIEPLDVRNTSGDQLKGASDRHHRLPCLFSRRVQAGGEQHRA